MLPELTVELMLEMPQATGLSEPQVPENNCNLVPDVFRSAPGAESVTVRFVPEAVILYHTSSSGLPVAQEGEATPLAVASHTVPALLATPLERVMAPVHSSLAGGPTTVAVIVN